MNSGVVEHQPICNVIYHGSFRYFNLSLRYTESASARLHSFRKDHLNCAAGARESPLGPGHSMAFAAEATCADVHLTVFLAWHPSVRALALPLAPVPLPSPALFR